MVKNDSLDRSFPPINWIERFALVSNNKLYFLKASDCVRLPTWVYVYLTLS